MERDNSRLTSVMAAAPCCCTSLSAASRTPGERNQAGDDALGNAKRRSVCPVGYRIGSLRGAHSTEASLLATHPGHFAQQPVNRAGQFVFPLGETAPFRRDLPPPHRRRAPLPWRRAIGGRPLKRRAFFALRPLTPLRGTPGALAATR